MLFVSLIRWWYGLGWFDQLRLVQARLGRTADFFSIGLSFRTFFKPFKQIDADRSRKGSIDVILRATFDSLFSRLFGAVVRALLILAGCLALFAEALIGVLRLATWPLVLILPVLSVPLVLSGWTPWQ